MKGCGVLKDPHKHGHVWLIGDKTEGVDRVVYYV